MDGTEPCTEEKQPGNGTSSEPLPRASPVEYSEQLAVELCRRLSSGTPLNKVCEAPDMPNDSTVFRWLQSNEDFCALYDRARVASATTFFYQAIAISDEKPPADLHPSAYGAWVQQQRLRADMRRWAAGRLHKRLYGDQAQIDVTSTVVEVEVDPIELGRRIALILMQAAQAQDERERTTQRLLEYTLPEDALPQ